MTDDKFDPDESHFSDEELEAALAGFEKRIRGRFGIRRCQ